MFVTRPPFAWEGANDVHKPDVCGLYLPHSLSLKEVEDNAQHSSSRAALARDASGLQPQDRRSPALTTHDDSPLYRMIHDPVRPHRHPNGSPDPSRPLLRCEADSETHDLGQVYPPDLNADDDSGSLSDFEPETPRAQTHAQHHDGSDFLTKGSEQAELCPSCRTTLQRLCVDALSCAEHVSHLHPAVCAGRGMHVVRET